MLLIFVKCYDVSFCYIEIDLVRLSNGILKCMVNHYGFLLLKVCLSGVFYPFLGLINT
jgi:hypothetical protein